MSDSKDCPDKPNAGACVRVTCDDNKPHCAEFFSDYECKVVEDKPSCNNEASDKSVINSTFYEGKRCVDAIWEAGSAIVSDCPDKPNAGACVYLTDSERTQKDFGRIITDYKCEVVENRDSCDHVLRLGVPEKRQFYEGKRCTDALWETLSTHPTFLPFRDPPMKAPIPWYKRLWEGFIGEFEDPTHVKDNFEKTCKTGMTWAEQDAARLTCAVGIGYLCEGNPACMPLMRSICSSGEEGSEYSIQAMLKTLSEKNFDVFHHKEINEDFCRTLCNSFAQDDEHKCH